MPGLQRNLSGCLSVIFVGALALAAIFVLLRPAPPLADAPIHLPQNGSVAADPSPGATATDVALPSLRHDSAPAAEPQGPEHRRRGRPSPPEPSSPSEPPAPTTNEPDADALPAPRSSGAAPGRRSSIVENVTVLDRGERVVYRGSVDVGPTLERIAAGQRLDFPDDGVVFQNRERRLPAQPRGYYHEYVLPTPNLPGPGPQRVVLGREGEVYYTPDHYRTFRRLN